MRNTGSVFAMYRTNTFADAIKKPEHNPINAASVNNAVPGFKINTTPIKPITNATAVSIDTFSLSIGIDNKPINNGDVAFNKVDSDKPI